MKTKKKMWIKSLMAPANTLTSTMVLDYSYIAPYSNNYGINIKVDMLYNMPEVKGGFFTNPPGNVYKVIYSIVPPGLYYKDPPMSDEVSFTQKEDYERPYRSPIFLDEAKRFTPPLLDDQSLLVIEVRSVTIAPSSDKRKSGAQKNTQPDITVEPPSANEKCFWSLLPLSKESVEGGGYTYTVSGTFQIPLIKGAIPSSDLFNADVREPLNEVFKRLAPSSGDASSLRLSEGSSLLVRIANPICEKLLDFMKRDSRDPIKNEIHTSFMEKMLNVASRGNGLQMKPKFDYDTSKMLLDKTTLQRMPGGGGGLDVKAIQKSINELFSEKSGIKMNG